MNAGLGFGHLGGHIVQVVRADLRATPAALFPLFIKYIYSPLVLCLL